MTIFLKGFLSASETDTGNGVAFASFAAGGATGVSIGGCVAGVKAGIRAGVEDGSGVGLMG